MSMAFLYPFIIFLQPGILWPQLAPFKPGLLISVIALIVGLMHRRASTERATRQLSHGIFISLCIFVVVQAISVHYSGMAAMLGYLIFWMGYGMFVAASVLLIRDVKALMQFIMGTIAGSAVVILYGLYAVATHSPKLAGNRAGAYGMYENHNDYTFIILMSMPFAVMAIPLMKTRFAKMLLGGFVVACVVGTALSLSRGGMICLVFMAGLLYWRITKGGLRVAGIVALSILGAGAIAWQFAAREENQAGHYTAEDAKTSRYELWRAARKVFEAHPLLGVGSGRFGEHAQDYAEISKDNRGKVTHNTYLEVLTGTGLLGLGSFLFMLWGMIRVSSARWGPTDSAVPEPIRIAAQVCILSLMLRSMLDAKAHDWSYYMLATVCIAIASLKSPDKTPVAETAKAAERALAKNRVPHSVRPAVYSRRA
jgi:O-antigen ligase